MADTPEKPPQEAEPAEAATTDEQAAASQEAPTGAASDTGQSMPVADDAPAVPEAPTSDADGQAEVAASDKPAGDITAENPDEDGTSTIDAKGPEEAASDEKAPQLEQSEQAEKNEEEENEENEAKEQTPPSFEQLALYAKTLLKIRVPIEVTLAARKMSLKEVVEMVPGSILQFNKQCDETLTMSIGNVQLAEGEAVKVGEKFGLRITSITLPAERFQTVRT